MAFYVKITKIEDSEEFVKYQFTSDGKNIGRLLIRKSNGASELLEAMPGDKSGSYFARAAAKLKKEWREGRYPEISEWAS